MNGNENNMTISIDDFVGLLVKKSNVSEQLVEEFVKVLLATIEDALIVGDTVKVKGLGEFESQWNESKEIFDPQTQQFTTISGDYNVMFRPAESLRALINEPFAHLEPIILNVPNFKPTKIGLSSDKDTHSGGKKDANEPLKVFQDQAKEIKDLLYEIGSMKPIAGQQNTSSEAKSDISNPVKNENDKSSDISVTKVDVEQKATTITRTDVVNEPTETSISEEKNQIKLDKLPQQNISVRMDLVGTVVDDKEITASEDDMSFDDFDVVCDFSKKEPLQNDIPSPLFTTIETNRTDGLPENDTLPTSTSVSLTVDVEKTLAESTLSTIKESDSIVEEEPMETNDVATNEVHTLYGTEDDCQQEEKNEEEISILEDVEEEIDLVAENTGVSSSDNFLEITEELPPQKKYTDEGVVYTIDTEDDLEASIDDDDMIETNPIDEQNDIEEKENEVAEENRKNRFWLYYIIGASVIFGILVFLFSPKLLQQMNNKKKATKFDYIADSVSEALKIQQIKDSIYELKLEEEKEENQKMGSDTLIENERIDTTDTLVPAALREFDSTSSSTSKEQISTTSKNESTAETNIFSVPRTYDEVVDVITFNRGMNMSVLARKYYGHTDFWVYIYEANRLAIKDPNNIPVGTKLKIPKMDKRIVDPNSKLSIAYALELKKKYLR